MLDRDERDKLREIERQVNAADPGAMLETCG
jgi:hypothetical protein